MTRLYIHCALPAEARPFIDRYRLKQQCAKPFAIYAADDAYLVVSGIGKVMTAAALGVLYGQYGQQRGVWINVGICGARGYEIGQACLAHKLIDANSGDALYPPQIVDTGVASAVIYSGDKIEETFAQTGLYDMEASAFFAVANRFSSAELVQSFKVVSDTADSGTNHVDKALATRLLGDAMVKFDQLKSALLCLADEIPSDTALNAAIDSLIARWRFSVSQQNQLKALVLRLKALEGGVEFLHSLEGLPDSRAVLNTLMQHLEQSSPEFV